MRARIFVILVSFAAVSVTGALAETEPKSCNSANGLCGGTPYPELCLGVLRVFPSELGDALPGNLVSSIVKSCANIVQKTFSFASSMLPSQVSSPPEQDALDDCVELLNITNDQLNDALTSLVKLNPIRPVLPPDGDITTFLSASLTNQDTCIESLDATRGVIKGQLISPVTQISQLLSNSLSIASKFSASLNEFNPRKTRNRRLTPFNAHRGRLLQASLSELATMANVTVALDGSGDFKNISAAIDAAPSQSAQRHLIYIKGGLYKEKVTIKRKKTNIMLVGAGKSSTIISFGDNVVDRTTTYRSATFAVMGSGFTARDIGFENTAGPRKGQAVAMRSGSDMSVFYRCSFRGYQDTLYAHSQRQFYRECDIYGTVDFIFGNAAAVFQMCRLVARQGLPGQVITVTAQGRKDANQNTGIAVQQCTVSTETSVTAKSRQSFPTYLGRPWHQYSRTIVMESYLDWNVKPQGWLPWNTSNFALDTLYYGEYMNRGPASGLAGRVNWSGFHHMAADDAARFTVSAFLRGNLWLPPRGVTFSAGLTSP